MDERSVKLHILDNGVPIVIPDEGLTELDEDVLGDSTYVLSEEEVINLANSRVIQLQDMGNLRMAYRIIRTVVRNIVMYPGTNNIKSADVDIHVRIPINNSASSVGTNEISNNGQINGQNNGQINGQNNGLNNENNNSYVPYDPYKPNILFNNTNNNNNKVIRPARRYKFHEEGGRRNRKRNTRRRKANRKSSRKNRK